MEDYDDHEEMMDEYQEWLKKLPPARSDVYRPSIRDCIEGSYKEGHELEWSLEGNIVSIVYTSIRPPWHNWRNGVECNISRELAKYYPHLTVEWI